MRCVRCRHLRGKKGAYYCREGGYTEIGNPNVKRKPGDEWYCSGWRNR